MPKTKTKIALPKTLGACADMLYDTRIKRLALQKEVDALEAIESALKSKLIDELPVSAASGISGKKARVRIEVKSTWQSEDWEKVQKYILKTKDFSIMQRRLSNESIDERVEAGVKIPGVKPFTYKAVSINKL